MTWVEVGAQTGQADADNSLPVVLANNATVDTDIADETLLNEIRAAVMAIAGTKGIVADLRVSVVNAPGVVVNSGTVTTVTTVTTVATVTNQAQMGGLPTNVAVPNWQNQTACQAFITNITRS